MERGFKKIVFYELKHEKRRESFWVAPVVKYEPHDTCVLFCAVWIFFFVESKYLLTKSAKKTEENIRWMGEKKNINPSLSAESYQHPGMEIKVSCALNLKLGEKN